MVLAQINILVMSSYECCQVSLILVTLKVCMDVILVMYH
jgi:hypothetical protein